MVHGWFICDHFSSLLWKKSAVEEEEVVIKKKNVVASRKTQIVQYGDLYRVEIRAPLCKCAALKANGSVQLQTCGELSNTALIKNGGKFWMQSQKKSFGSLQISDFKVQNQNEETPPLPSAEHHLYAGDIIWNLSAKFPPICLFAPSQSYNVHITLDANKYV